MHRIKFGTDGWRAVIAKDFTVENVARVSKAAALWILSNYSDPSVVIGYDTRFGGKLFAETAAKVFARNNVKVYISEGIVTTPMVSLGIIRLYAKLGVVITASHNSQEYNGYKLKGEYGGPLLDRDKMW
jgi:phosphomannomutase